MLGKSLSLLSLTLLAGCATNAAKPLQLQAAQLVVHQAAPIVVVPQVETEAVNQVTSNQPLLQDAFKTYLKTGKAKDIITSGNIKFAYSPDQTYVVYCRPFTITLVSLSPGEHFTSLQTGDPNNWSLSVVQSGTDPITQHIEIKPAGTDLLTNFIITTDKRVYSLQLHSGKVNSSEVSRNVSFWYPSELVQQVNDQVKSYNQKQEFSTPQIPSLDLTKANFNYTIKGPKGLNWLPRRIFDDGVHTWIQFPQGLSSQDLPTLLIDHLDSTEKFNYSFVSPYMVVEGVFQQAVLLLGVGSHQTLVYLIRNA